MKMRTRKLVGTVLMLVFVMIYALMAMALAQGRITEAPRLAQLFFYAFLGLFWIVPAAFLVKWMERPDPPTS